MVEPIRFSIVVPAYNAEECLSTCLESVLSQSYSPYEVIVVNDGSTDGTLRLCKRFSELYPCIQVVDKANGGLSSARNAGTVVATGDYVLYLDVDDAIVHDALRELSSYLIRNKVDILTFGFKEIDYQDNKLRREWAPPEMTASTIIDRDAYAKLLDDGLLENYAWTRVYSAGFLNQSGKAFAESVSFLEDIEFTYRVCLTANSFGFLPMPLYIYRRQLGSMCTSVSTNRARDGYLVLKRAFEARGGLMSDRALNGFLGTLFMCYDLASDRSDPEARTVRNEIYSYALKLSGSVRYLSRINRLKLLLIRLRLYPMARYVIDFLR